MTGRGTSSRRGQFDLLARPPYSATLYEGSWGALFVDTAGQLNALADLVARGLLSTEEFEQQKAKVIEPWPVDYPPRRETPG